MSGAVLKLPVRRRRACERFVEPTRGELKWCAGCGFTKLLHPAAVSTFHCGACGRQLRDGDDDSPCSEHGGKGAA